MRLRQYYANRYQSAAATSDEFENVIRYLNSAELGNLTLAELLAKIFDADGELNLGIRFRYNPATGVEYNIDPTTDTWTLLFTLDQVRGSPGSNVGEIQSPLFYNRTDITSTAGQTVFPYTIVATAADVLVWINGVLQPSSAYVFSRLSNTVTLGTAPSTGSLVTLTSIRTSPATAYRRQDFVAAATQVVFPFPFADTEELVLYRNGVLQREGGGYDYVKSSATSTITMTTAQSVGTLISAICITNSAIRDVAGIMLEDGYTNGDGLIRLDRVSIADGALTQAKVNGLTDALAARPVVFVQGTQPGGTIASGSFWINTSYATPALFFYDGTRWLSGSPNGMIPAAQIANALQFVRLNASATGLEYAAVDLSSLISTSARGAASGVAPLDASGLLPASIIPQFVARAPFSGILSGALSNTTYNIGAISNQHMFDGIAAVCSTGSCTVQLYVNGSPVGSTLGVTTTMAKLAITPATISGLTVPVVVSLVVTGNAACSNLVYSVNSEIVG